MEERQKRPCREIPGWRKKRVRLGINDEKIGRLREQEEKDIEKFRLVSRNFDLTEEDLRKIIREFEGY